MTTITFDPAKRDWTLKHRGLDFIDADKVFAGDVANIVDDRFAYGGSSEYHRGLVARPHCSDRLDTARRGPPRHFDEVLPC